MSTELDIDIAVMVGEMEAIPCEHSQHGMAGLAHDDGAATHYAQGYCSACGHLGSVLPVCSAYAACVTANWLMECRSCGARGFAKDFSRILGLVNP